MADFSEFDDLGMIQGRMIQDGLLEAHIMNEIGTMEKQLNDKKNALAKKKAEAVRVTERKEDQEQDDLSLVSNSALVGAQASAFDFCVPPRRGCVF
jgi:hypothetical protein